MKKAVLLALVCVFSCSWAAAQSSKDANGHAYVDLGLPSGLLWATCNIGSTTPEGYGDYFAWGETEKKGFYRMGNYKLVENLGDSWMLSKYSFIDEVFTLEPIDDAARANWGGGWRMPTSADWKELCEKCTWTWITQKNVSGYKAVGPNGKSIFLPAAGIIIDKYEDGLGESGYYWSSSLYDKKNSRAEYVNFLSSLPPLWFTFGRECGMTVRPVLGEGVPVPSLHLSEKMLSFSLKGGEKGFIISSKEPWTVSTDADWMKLSETSGTDFSIFSVKALPNTTGKTRSGRLKFVAGETLDSIFVWQRDDYEYVDLGLPSGTRWATCNVGADNPEDFGDKFAWGETKTKSEYTWENLKYNTEGGYTKYVLSSTLGKVDNKDVLDLSDDAARANWGGGWRMPTHDDWLELQNKCKWTWTTKNGNSGYEVVGPNDRSIFLPAAGYFIGTETGGAPDVGLYWSSTASVLDAYCMRFSSSGVKLLKNDRKNGLSVRPVTRILKIPLKTLHLVSSGESKALPVWTERPWTASSNVVWLTLSETSGEGDVTLQVTAEANTSQTSRKGTILFLVGNVAEDSILVTQGAAQGEHEYVDLGLRSGLLWATCNVGASRPEVCGDYYAWAETATKGTYTWKTYKYRDEGTDKNLSKYNSVFTTDGERDNKTELDPSDDVAHVLWGGDWRMPTPDEWAELRDSCKWKWQTFFFSSSWGNTSGFKVTGPNGNSIFLPAAGVFDERVADVGEKGYYWSTTASDERASRRATLGHFNSSGMSKNRTSISDRYHGYSVRPVRRP